MIALNSTTGPSSPSIQFARNAARHEPASVLILGAHPDDACLGAGGFASILVDQGRRVVFITATDGRRGGDPTIRNQEDRDSAAILGVELVTWNLPDCQMPSQAPIELLGRAIEQFSPDMI